MYNQESLDVIKSLGSDEKNGLRIEQVEESRAKYGANALEEKKKVSIFIKFLLAFKDTLIIILLIAAIISFIVHPEDWIDSVIIVVVVLLNAILGVYQENKAEQSLASLKKMSSPHAKVIRDGQVKEIVSEEVVVGDIILLEAGDIVPADARIIDSFNLKADESALTGESVPSQKESAAIYKDNLSVGDQNNMLFASTAVTNGRATAVVTAVGMNTEVGEIAKMLLHEDEATTPLQNKLTQIGKIIGIMAIGICGVVFILEMIAGVKWVDALKSSVALAVAAIPEGLATVVTIVLAIGVTKMSKENAIVKKLPAVETLGCTGIVCSDKTGTLTQNKMTVVELYHNKLKPVNKANEEDIKFIKYFALCSDAKIILQDNEEKRIGDPTELALIELNNQYGESIEGIERIGEIPFDSERKLMTVVCKINGELISITKGAVDNILGLSNDKNKEEILKINHNMGTRALRVLGLGYKKINQIPKNLNDLETELTFIGLVGMIDPPRPEVKEAIKVAKGAGVRSIMITGDHVITATAIAKELGILGEGHKAISSKELSKLSDEELFNQIEQYSVYARVSPKDKVRIVNAWKKRGAVVAMTGDGVNDAPALKNADIGCAMGINGTEVSKEAADMILLDDNFSTIIVAIKEGRGIYANLKKCLMYLLSSNIGEVLTIFLAVLITALGITDLGVPLLAVHLLWINLVTDAIPAFALGMEKPEETVMEEKPRNAKEGFFANKLGTKIIIYGIYIGLITLISYIIGESQVAKYGQETAHMIGQTMAFITLSTTQLFHSFSLKSNKSIFSKSTFNNKTLIFAFLIGFIMQFGVVYIPGVNDVFSTYPLGITNLLISLGLSISVILFAEVVKLITKKLNK